MATFSSQSSALMENHPALKAWMKWQGCPETANETKDFMRRVDSGELPESSITERFGKQLQFGTAGLRGRMDIGFNRFNTVTVLQTSQGIAEYLHQTHGEEKCSIQGVAIGFDGRRNSQRYAQCAAAVFKVRGIKVYLNSHTTPTPLVAFTVLNYKCLMGIMITASHNPKDDNGYKVYGENGAQILSPTDRHIMMNIEKNNVPWDGVFDQLDDNCFLKSVSDFIDPSKDIEEKYTECMVAELSNNKPLMERSNIKIVYTAMHGVGYPVLSKLLQLFGFNKNLCPVPTQQHPNSDFPTLPFPNPEEQGALTVAMQYADSIDSSIVIATDPDADRFSIAEKQNNRWYQFTGDQIGILLANYRMEKCKQNGAPPSKMLFAATLVSSRMLQQFARKEGAHYVDSLTGFKWIMDGALKYMETMDCEPILLYEEAIGYALSKKLRDKDGITAAAVFVELLCELYEKGSNLQQHLKELYDNYGYFQTNNGYVICHDPLEIKRKFDLLRQEGKEHLKLGSFNIVSMRDITNGYDSAEADKLCRIPMTPDAEMLCFSLSNGGSVTLRASGTEPKMKYYCEMQTKSCEGSTELTQLVEVVKQLLAR